MLFRTLRSDDIERLYEPPSRPHAAEWIRQQAAGEVYVVVAEVDGIPVGHRCLNFQWHRAEDAVYGFALGVLPAWRSRGIGTAIDVHCEAVARSHGFGALRAGIEKTNVRGLAWHQRIGYRILHDREIRWTDLGVERVTHCTIVERRWSDAGSIRGRVRRFWHTTGKRYLRATRPEEGP